MRRITSKVLLLAATFCIVTVKLFAQSSNEGKITGKILDAQTNETIPFATAMLLDRKTKKTVKIIQTDEDGSFAITGIAKGIYTFKASYVGFQTMVRDSVAITDAVNQMITTGSTSVTDFSRLWVGKQANLTFSYRFGKTSFDFKKTKKADEQGGRPDEESF